ncbi:MAG: hypothetical protein J6U68_05075 [Clostridia bacterium]|nr:hypothetical protein [Clostridia bacterium]
MKKIKLLAAFMALALSASMLLTACGSKEEGNIEVADIMNPEYVVEEEKILSSAAKLSLAGDYATAKGNFIITTDKLESEGATAKSTTYIYNAETGKAAATLTSTASENSYTTYFYDIISDEYFAVLTMSKSGSASSSSNGYSAKSTTFNCTLNFADNYSNTLTIRNASGTTVETISNSDLMAYCKANGDTLDTIYKNELIVEYQDADSHQTSCDLFEVNSKVYRIGEDDSITLVKDFGLTKKPASVESLKKVGETYYGMKTETTMAVYDKDLNELFTYTLPEYVLELLYAESAEGEATTEPVFYCTLLADGKLLIQYAVQLDQNEEKYDFRSKADGRYDLVTTLIDAEGKVTDVDADFVIADVDPSVADEKGQMVYSDKVENLAFIHYIGENKMLDRTEATRKLAILSNDAKVDGVVAIDGIIDDVFPSHYKSKYYKVELIDSTVLYDKETGEKVSELTDISGYLSGDYFFNKKTKAIYDIKGEKIKDLKTTPAESCGDSLILSSVSLKGSTYSLFVDGETKTIGTVSTDAADKDTAYSSIAWGAGYYYTAKKAMSEAKGEEVITYTYYNEKGARFFSTECKLSIVLSTEDFVIMRGEDEVEVTENGKTKTKTVDVFYRVTKA